MKKLLLCLTATLLCALFSACKDESSPIGLNLIDNPLNSTYTDTITLQAYSMLEDTLNTTNSSADMLGHLSDPIFGNSSAAIYTQLSLSGSSVNFGTQPVIDSVVLTLQLSSYYGDTNSLVGIRVHQLTNSLDSTVQYYQTSTVDYDPTVLNYSTTGYSIRPKTPVVVDTGLYNAHLRIRLAQSFGQYLLDNQDELNHNFRDFLKGLYIEATSHTGACGYFLITNLNSALSGVTLYYHNSDGTGKRYTLGISEKCVRFTHLEHNYNTTTDNLFYQEVLQGQTDLGNDVLFVQGGGGVKTRITFPYLQQSFLEYNNRVVIHRAELVITNIDVNEQYLTQPSMLTLQGISKSTGKTRFLPDDDYYTSTAYFGGSYDSKSREYRFRITSYIQELIKGQGDWENYINLVVRGAAVRPHRLVCQGTDEAASSRIRLEIVYSTY